eukprot:Protomagalhaensia_wolfi_Nauph_80__4792@NODE_49_length_4188_cov_38_845264_g40_i0_p1_GENE_NODE_49_length_4188_cov_38_845264_g40_i0NODE_49_length_4188_cov_38_845264_g40_i0_p1_ORF_typecomplete_len463_score114_35Thioredoxin/PF00085_20/7_5e30Thioredoxin/PF00085_20/3_4e03Thioredoxin/PF00085_20/0_0032Thioredoxin/PF00085_20/1_8e22Thioredoxin_6/PF13848_6/33Thioredoxin_6/PF13848_6/4_4e05Thioredoxin_6/PF13848_6/9_9e23Thioredoxin_6/PF13848_6/0_036Calsequestrin/PF01216_17/2_5e15Calsequestrin/PF01216_17/6_4e02
MKTFIISLLLLLVATASNVVSLTTSNFDTFIKANPVVLVKFFAPWCGHCKKLAPAYEAAAADLQAKNGPPLAEVDATQDQDLSKRFGVQGFPTFFLFRNGQPEPYTGGRSQEAIVDWVLKMTGPAVESASSVTEARKKAEANKASIYFIATVRSKDSAKVYEAVASEHRLKGSFFLITDPSAEADTVSVYRQDEDSTTTKLTSKEQFIAWVLTEAVPLLGPVSGENYATYAARSPNWFWFAAYPEDYEKLGPIIRKVSKNYRTDFNFVWLDVDTLKEHANNALGMKDFPGVTIVLEEAKYRFEGQAITEKALTKFVEAVKAGKVKKFLKSEPVPESNDEAVKVVVGTQFAEMVLRKDKDVFLKIYAPWCGHCKKLAPMWDDLAERTAKSEHFMVAKLDGTANEIDVPGFSVHGFPTLYFVKAGSKTPIAYDGERTIEAFLDFVKKHAAYPINVSDGASKEEL